MVSAASYRQSKDRAFQRLAELVATGETKPDGGPFLAIPWSDGLAIANPKILLLPLGRILDVDVRADRFLLHQYRDVLNQDVIRGLASGTVLRYSLSPTPFG